MIIFILLLPLFVIFPATAQETVKSTPKQLSQMMSEEEKKTFLNKNLSGALRGFVWGLPPTVILENEKATFVGEEDGNLFYLDYIKGMRSTIGYEFIDNKLWRARIFIEKEYFDTQERIRDLMSIREDLSNRFGDPVDELMVWYDSKEKNFPDNWGWAILRGELTMTMVFQDAETEIVVFLGADRKLNPDLEAPQLNLTYTSLEYKKTFGAAPAKNYLKLP